MNRNADKHNNIQDPEVIPESVSESGQVPEAIPSELSAARIEALAVLGLHASANTYAIDNRFWQLTKRYRLEKNPEKLNEVTQAYEIASGRAAEKMAESAVHLKSMKYFGRSARQWKLHIYYSWWKYVLVLLVLIIGTVLVKQIFFGKEYDIKVVSLGHIVMDNTYVQNYAVDEMGFTNPYFTFADLIVDDSDPQTLTTLNGPAAASSFLSINPDVLIFDTRTMPYYLPYLQPLDNYYEMLQDIIPLTLLDKITPVTMSMADYSALVADPEEQDPSVSGDTEQHVYGLLTNDPDLIHALGYSNLWSKDEISLVFTICDTSKNASNAEKFITAIIMDQNKIVSAYLEKEASSE